MEIIIAMLEKLITIEKQGQNREEIIHALKYQLKEAKGEIPNEV